MYRQRYGDGIAITGKESLVSRIIITCLALITCALCGQMAQARDIAPETPRSSACLATPAVGAISYPGAAKIPTTNNLVQPTGKPLPAPGQIVFLMGKVLDADCNPLDDVRVEMWQPDPFSKFMIPNESDMASPVAMFAGAGRTYTDIDGTFSFITLFPGTIKICQRRDTRGRCIATLERAPFFNVRIAGKPLRAPLMAGLFFENDRRNATDPIYKRLSPEAQRRITMKVLPSDAGDYNSGMRTYLELVVPTTAHTHGY